MTNLKFLVCETLQREFEEILQTNVWENIDYQFLPMRCLRSQSRISQQTCLQKPARQPKENIVDISGCFIPKVEESQPQSHSKIDPQGTCFNLLVNNDLVTHFVDEGGYVITPGWLGNWENHLLEWGFDKQTARDFFHECIKKLVLLDTGVNPSSCDELNKMGNYLDLPVEVIPVGLDHLNLSLMQIVTDWNKKIGQENSKSDILIANKRASDFAMALSMLTDLTRFKDFEKLIEGIKNLFLILFSAEKVTCFVVDPALQTECKDNPDNQLMGELIEKWRHDHPEEQYALTPSGDGFFFKINHMDQTIVIILVENLQFPQHLSHYLNLSLQISQICGISIIKTQLFSKVQQLSVTDPLTSIYNRRYFDEYVEIELQRARRYGHPLSLCMLDIDHFKRVNDEHGHDAGDIILKKLTEIIQNKLRKSDVFCRYGGEEFLILLPETDLQAALIFANRKRVEIAKTPFDIGQKEIQITVSMGVSQLDDQCQDFKDLFKKSDLALYEAKNAGRNCCKS